jgi:hypothetical protein
MRLVGRKLAKIEKILWKIAKVAFTTAGLLSIFLAVGSDPTFVTMEFTADFQSG